MSGQSVPLRLQRRSRLKGLSDLLRLQHPWGLRDQLHRQHLSGLRDR